MGFFKSISQHLAFRPRLWAGKPDARCYAVGDVHGRLDLLEELLELIERDMKVAPVREAFLVFLGDLIDRGPDSAGVIERLQFYSLDGAKIVFLGGNHEDVLLSVLEEEPGLLANWLRYGGSEFVRSYGIDPARIARMSERQAAAALRETVPPEHIAFIERMGDTFRFGDFLLVHAGIRPGLPLSEQARKDLRWIREPFLSDTSDHEVVVVHGHTVVEAVDERPNRIAIDTGAVRSGRLTALVIEGEDRRYLATYRPETGMKAPGAGVAPASALR